MRSPNARIRYFEASRRNHAGDYNGFAWETPELYGAERENHSAAPGTKVTLAHATFVASEPGSKSPWKLLGAEHYIGEFGGMEQGNTVDTTRQPQTFVTDDSRLVLAVPTWSLQSGVRILSYDALVFKPKETENVNDKHWTYIGNIPAGEDNSANCGEDAPGKIACVKNSSTLAFVKQPGLPALRVTVSADPPTSGGGATVEYRYDAATASKSYLPTPEDRTKGIGSGGVPLQPRGCSTQSRTLSDADELLTSPSARHH